MNEGEGNEGRNEFKRDGGGGGNNECMNEEGRVGKKRVNERGRDEEDEMR